MSVITHSHAKKLKNEKILISELRTNRLRWFGHVEMLNVGNCVKHCIAIGVEGMR